MVDNFACVVRSPVSMVKEGDIIWAKLRGYPWWPAEVVKNERLPKAIKSTDNDSIPVCFFGSRDYALINKDHIKNFDSENWKLFKNKSKAPKFKSAVQEARKKCSPEIKNCSTQEMVVAKKRGRPRKLKLLEARKRLQQLLYSKNLSCTEEIIAILERINKTNEIDKDEFESSKLGNLLKKVFCSDDFKVWHSNKDLLTVVNTITRKIINLK